MFLTLDQPAIKIREVPPCEGFPLFPQLLSDEFLYIHRGDQAWYCIAGPGDPSVKRDLRFEALEFVQFGGPKETELLTFLGEDLL